MRLLPIISLICMVLLPRHGLPETMGNECLPCHTEAGWHIVDYKRHAQTLFPLKGAHQGAPCVDCHTRGFEAKMDRSCRACHQDAHGGQLGYMCEGCHNEERWDDAFNADFHRSSNFPLTGKHALMPCQECHQRSEGRAFSAVALRCVDCHQTEYARAALTSIDHAQSNFPGNCESCHFTWTFKAAKFAAHDNCFLISRGPHVRVRCDQCHTTVAGLRSNGACATLNAVCIQCHEHRRSKTDQEHTGIAGYQYKDRKCYECHRFVP